MAFFKPSYGYVEPPGPDANFLERYKYINQTSPEALMALGAGISQGDISKGFLGAATAMRASREDQQAAADKMFDWQEEQQNKDLARQWLISKGHTPEEAEAAVSNPTILASILKDEYGTGASDEVYGTVQ